MGSKLKNKIEPLMWCCWIIVAALFILKFSYYTSPLFSDYGEDSAIFVMLGKGVINGKVPYVGIFDHKGPLVFFIQALGQKISYGRMGIFLVQIIFLSLSLICIYNISKLILNRWISSIVVFFYLYIYYVTFYGGNLTEEYSIPFCFISIYFALKYALSKDEEHPPKYAFIYGVCFMVIALIRINNGVSIAAIVLAILIELIIKKKFKNIGSNMLAFIAGMGLVFIPIAIYFLIKGAFMEMINGTFIFNIIYSKNTVFKSSKVFNRMAMTPCLVGIIGSITYLLCKKNYRIFAMISSVSIFSFISVRIGHEFIHYLMLITIPFTLGVILIFSVIEEKLFKVDTLNVIAKFCAISLITYTIFIYRNYNITHKSRVARGKDNKQNKYAISLANNIPQAEKENVFGYNTAASWFAATDIIPCHRYFTLQEWWGRFNPHIKEDINYMLLNNPPKWIVVTSLNKSQNETLKEVIDREYEKIDENEPYKNIKISLFRHKN